jgi:hypothetical protein
MRDLQFIVLSDNLPITSVTELSGEAVRTIRVEGSGNFTYAKKVVINDFSITDFTLVSRTVLYVRPPSSFDSVDVVDMDVVVFSSQLTDPASAIVEFDLTNTFTSVEGTQKLAQQVLKTLISTTQTNRFSVTEGGSLVKNLSGTLNPDESSTIATQLSRSISDTKSYYLKAQTGTNLPSNEKLLELTLNSLEFDSSSLEVRATVKMVTFSGQSELLPITL